MANCAALAAAADHAHTQPASYIAMTGCQSLVWSLRACDVCLRGDEQI